MKKASGVISQELLSLYTAIVLLNLFLELLQKTQRCDSSFLAVSRACKVSNLCNVKSIKLRTAVCKLTMNCDRQRLIPSC